MTALIEIRHLEKHAGQTAEEFYADDEHTTLIDSFKVDSEDIAGFVVWSGLQTGTRFTVGNLTYHLFFKEIDFDCIGEEYSTKIKLFVIRVESPD